MSFFMYPTKLAGALVVVRHVIGIGIVPPLYALPSPILHLLQVEIDRVRP